MHENKIYNCVCLLFDEKSGTFLDSLRLIGPAPGLGSQKKKKKNSNALQHLAVPIRVGYAKNLNKNPVAETVLELKV